MHARKRKSRTTSSVVHLSLKEHTNPFWNLKQPVQRGLGCEYDFDASLRIHVFATLVLTVVMLWICKRQGWTQGNEALEHRAGSYRRTSLSPTYPLGFLYHVASPFHMQPYLPLCPLTMMQCSQNDLTRDCTDGMFRLKLSFQNYEPVFCIKNSVSMFCYSKGKWTETERKVQIKIGQAHRVKVVFYLIFIF